MKKRNINLDIIRSIAVFSVLSVHFFLNNGFYTEIIKGKRMFVMFTMRTAFMICVPLFAILTGYLMNKKILSKTYYLGLVKTYITYLLASVFDILFLSCYTSEHIGIRTFILRILNFSSM
ncbi:acyltransferase family protein [Mediterraneibacter faecis]|uniref:acyltransferase family protein n=1 Tax=Mediterraneibacter faecis TaxID=592978 RepID=UPI003D71F91D